MSELEAKGAVARMLGGAGGDKVAHAGKSHAGHGLTAAGVYQAADLGQTTRHDESERVVACARAGGDATHDGDDVFHGAADLDAGHVLRQVDAEGRGQQQLLKGLPYLLVFTGDDSGRKSATADLLGMVGARECRHARLVADLAGDDLAHEQAGLGLNTLGKTERRGVGGDKGCRLVADVAQVRRRHGKDDGLGAVERLSQVRRGDNVFREHVVHQIPGVAMLAVNAGGRLLAMGPHGHALGSRGGKAGDGGSPGAGANQRNIHDSLLLIVGLGDTLGKREFGLLTRHELFDVRTMGPYHGDADQRHAKLEAQAAVRKDRAGGDGKTDGGGK